MSYNFQQLNIVDYIMYVCMYIHTGLRNHALLCCSWQWLFKVWPMWIFGPNFISGLRITRAYFKEIFNPEIKLGPKIHIGQKTDQFVEFFELFVNLFRRSNSIFTKLQSDRTIASPAKADYFKSFGIFSSRASILVSRSVFTDDLKISCCDCS